MGNLVLNSQFGCTLTTTLKKIVFKKKKDWNSPNLVAQNINLLIQESKWTPKRHKSKGIHTEHIILNF